MSSCPALWLFQQELTGIDQKTQSPNLPNHQGLSAGIPDQHTHAARTNQGVSKSPEEDRGARVSDPDTSPAVLHVSVV